MSKTTFITDELLDHLYRNLSFASPTTVYAGLLEVVTGKEAGSVTETAYTGYARIAITFGAPAAGDSGGRKIDNTAAVTFGQKTDGGSNVMIAVGIFDAVSAGNLLFIIFLDGGAPLVFTMIAADLATDALSHGGHGLVDDQQVRIEQIAGMPTLPAGLAEDTTYHVVSAATDKIDLAATMGGASIDITAIGEVLVMPLNPVTVNQNDTPEFGIGDLVVEED